MLSPNIFDPSQAPALKVDHFICCWRPSVHAYVHTNAMKVHEGGIWEKCFLKQSSRMNPVHVHAMPTSVLYLF